jgi:hypothetical protein
MKQRRGRPFGKTAAPLQQKQQQVGKTAAPLQQKQQQVGNEGRLPQPLDPSNLSSSN